MVHHLPKAELHCHIEGAAAPDLVERQARKYGADTSPFIRDGAFVWSVVDGRVKQVPVRIVQRNTETVLVEGEIRGGDMVVTEGLQSVRDGDEVRIANAIVPRAAEAAGAPTQ